MAPPGVWPSVVSGLDGSSTHVFDWQLYVLPLGLLVLLAIAFKCLAPKLASRRLKNPDAFQRSGVHVWAHADFTTVPRYCNVCEKVMMGGILGEGGVCCDVCGTHAHEACLQHVQNNCKPLCSETVVALGSPGETEAPAGLGPVMEGQPTHEEDSAGATAGTAASHTVSARHHHQLEHHWVRGNLPTDSACTVCRAVCASAYGLQGVRCRVTAHSTCIPSLPSKCDLKELAPLVVPPWCFSSTRPEGLPGLEAATATPAADLDITLSTPQSLGSDVSRTPSAEGAGGASDGTQEAQGYRARLRRTARRLSHSVADTRWRRRLSALPGDVGKLSRSAIQRLRRRLRREESQKRDPVRFWCTDVPHGITPVVVLVNPGSGGRMGDRLLTMFRRLLNPLQVGNLAEGGPKPLLKRFSGCKRLRILACGGDGTAAWVMSALDEVRMSCAPALAVMPLGTGNDLARVMRWGPGASGPVTESMARKWLCHVGDAHVSMLDRWAVAIQPNAAPAPVPDDDHDDDDLDGDGAEEAAPSASPALRGLRARSRKAAKAKKAGALAKLRGRNCARRPRRQKRGPAHAVVTAAVQPPPTKPSKVMVNYLGIGVGAQVALKFHKLRQSYPGLFSSRLGNKVWYSQVGGVEILRRAFAQLPRNLRLECDGEVVELPSGTQGVIILNIASYGGGANLWGTAGVAAAAAGAAEEARRQSQTRDASPTNGQPLGVGDHDTRLLGSTPTLTARTAPTSFEGSREAASGTSGGAGAGAGAGAAVGAGVGAGGGEAGRRSPPSDSADWPRTSSSQFVAPAHGDGVLEVVAVTGSFHLAQTQVGLADAIRVAQCRTLKLTTYAKLPMQVDGEPELKEPSVIEISRLNKAVMLRRSVGQSGKVAARFVEVLEWGQAHGVLDRRQKTALLRELAARSEDLAM